MKEIKCMTCRYREWVGNSLYCLVLDHRLENGYAMLWYSRQCDVESVAPEDRLCRKIPISMVEYTARAGTIGSN